jgi:2-polyprenyl-3-methyl-5-hydroxy-6-metoxy-1,4-benzoquinol methylase
MGSGAPPSSPPPPAGGRDHDAEQAQALAARLFAAGLGAAELVAAYLGLRLGLYDALAAGGPATADRLAERAGIAPRYAREWLEQQAAAGVVEVDDPGKPPAERLYLLPPGHAEALTRPDSPFGVSALALLPIAAMAAVLPRLLEVFRTGGGVPFEAFGADFRAGQAALNRAVFEHRLASWIETFLPDLHARLAAGAARAADLGCGAGWSSIALARAYPGLEVDGYDLDPASVEEAERNATAAGVDGRVRFAVREAAAAGEPAGGYALVSIFDALHDMARPVEALRRCRALLAAGGSVLLLEPKAAERFTAPASETERFLYAVSLLHCLPVGLSEQPSAACGAVLRPEAVRAWAAEAGFDRCRVVPVEHRFHRLYRLEG